VRGDTACPESVTCGTAAAAAAAAAAGSSVGAQ
jgi:hypothetical protein